MEDVIRRLQQTEALSNLVGRSAAFVRAIACLPAVAASDRSVLITGETGTGKELVARAIHYMSARASRPMVAVNCGSLPDTLLEEELFGHERGAFTGAHAMRRGLVAEADSGTLFLDEVDTMPHKAQVSLLRVLQERRYRTIGSNLERAVDVRVLGASNESLEGLASSGRFRTDLYYRLSVFTLRLPPLRERRDDILLLAAHFVQKHAPAGRTPAFSPAAVASLEAHDWPGNVRELENVVVRALHLAEGPVLGPADLFDAVPARSGANVSGSAEAFNVAKQRVLEAFERQYLTRLISSHHGNVTHAARTAGKERRDLGKPLKKHGLDPQRFRAS